MSLETVQTAPEQPAQVAQKSSEKQIGASNTSSSDFAKKIAAAQVAPAAFTPKTEPAKPAPVTEASEAPNAEAKAEEPKTEAKAEVEETETEADEVLSPETQALDPKLQAKIDRRIGKEVGKTKKAIERAAAAEARAADLETRLSQQEPIEKEVHVPVSADTPLAHITTIDQLNTYKENLANDIVEAEMLLYSEFPAEGLDTKWGRVTRPALISALTQAKKDERSAVPARERFLLTRSQVTQTAQEKFPFLKDPTHPGYQMAKQALRDNPVLRTYPNTDYLVGVLVKGQLAMQAEEAAANGKAEAKAPVKPKAKPTNGQSEIASDASITRAPTGLMNQQALQSERAKVMGGKKSLGHKDFAELLKANQRFRNSQ